MSNFRPVDRETGFLLPPSVEEWLPERHLARFVVEVIEQLDLSAFVKAYRGSGSASYHPSMLLGLLVYGYATGVFSSRKLERATYDSVAFRFIAANDHPDHDTIAAFRRRFLDRIEGLFVEVLLLAREAGVLKLGTVALDGTKVHANASRHSALSWKHACELEARLKAEVAELMALAEAADGADVPDGMSVPEELARREDRLARIAEAKAVIEARARERLERERAEYEAKLEARAEKAEKTGRNPHDGEIITHAPNLMWGTDGVRVFTVDDGWGWIFTAVEHWNAECVGWHVCKRGDRFAALQPISMGLAGLYGSTAAGAARGLALRMDHGSQYLSDHFTNQIKFWGIQPSYAFVAEPQTNGVAERFNRTLKEQIIHGRIYRNIAELRDAVRDFVELYNAQWIVEKNGYLSPAQARQAWHAAISIRPAA